MQTESQSLQNALLSLNIEGLELHEKWNDDKRKTVKRYFITLNGRCISPVLDFNKLNHFIFGLIAYKKHLL